MSVARFIADERIFSRVPHTVRCAILGFSVSGFYKWRHREPTEKQTYGSPRIHADLLEEGWKVSVNTVTESMRRQGLKGHKPKRPKGFDPSVQDGGEGCWPAQCRSPQTPSGPATR